MILRRSLLALVVLPLVAGGGLVASATLPAGQVAEEPAPVTRVQHFYPHGPAAEYGSDYGSLQGMPPLLLQVPAGADRSGVLEVSFRYRTKGPGPFRIHPEVRDADGRTVTARPGTFVLAPAPGGDSTTLRFLAPRLAGGESYEVSIAANSTSTDRGTQWLRTHALVLTVELSSR